MAMSKERRETLLSMKSTGHLKPELQNMTDEEFLDFIEKRAECRKQKLSEQGTSGMSIMTPSEIASARRQYQDMIEAARKARDERDARKQKQKEEKKRQR